MKARIPQQGGMGGGAGNMQAMLRQAQKVQEDMENLQEELNHRTYEISAGGGAVTLTISGEKIVTDLKIAPEIVDPDDIETLSDIIIAAFNEGVKRVESTNAEEMARVSARMPNLGF
jgi:DNA-binding YbaB/EbfC family protein